jgi:hypothetical protein
MPTTETAAPVWESASHWTEDTRHVAHVRFRSTGIWLTTVTRRDRNTGYPTGKPRVTYRHNRMPRDLEFDSYEAACRWLAEHPAQ